MRRVRRKGGNKEKVFGCDLLEHLKASSQDVPQVLRCCSEFVETHGIVDGIYRLSGVSSNIQKLRGEFESDGSPDLNKDVYLQDIHCVSSLCKAYFRELPNPLLTYQLYDKFAEAVAIQLEEERLVKIRDVLKELPTQHHRTLEFLMLHLVKMASYSSETNMHARNLAIVWAPNLLRSKDIEASGFNGTAVFKEVRVQSIVVEFILTHVPQLFPQEGESNERRNSLPSPSAAFNQEEGFFKSGPTQPVLNFGNISPGDGPLPIRPYHAIIEGSDKRKGSLKGRKWMSIFNIGGRFHDPRRRHKHSAKEKDRPSLRPARSMDSLSTPSFSNEKGSRHSGQRTPSTDTTTPSTLVVPSSQPASDANLFTSAIGGSEYAVTYRRGTGIVSSGTGIQGTYTALDPEGLGVINNETVQSRSPGHSTKVGRRAAMHITGPTMVTVPLHITSNLAFGVLQGGGGDRVIHRGRDKEGGDRVDAKEGAEKVERNESREVEREPENGRKVEKEEKTHRGNVTDGDRVMDTEENLGAGAAGGEEEEGIVKEAQEKEGAREECGLIPELVTGAQGVSREHRAKSLISSSEEDNDEDAIIDDKDVDGNDGYMDMTSSAHFQPEGAQHGDEHVSDASNVLNSTQLEGYDLGLSSYVQDNFEFLDQMDCSVLDHVDCSVSYQVKEFSVEPPGHSDDEYIIMEPVQPSHHPVELHTHLQPDPAAQSQTMLKPHRPLSIDVQSRHTKSLSLPYMTSPVHAPDESCSEDEVAGDDSDYSDYSSDDNDDMFFKSLPPDFLLKDLSGLEPDSCVAHQESCTPDGAPVHQLQISEEVDIQYPTCKESIARDQSQIKVKDKEDRDGLEETMSTRMEEEDGVHHGRDGQENIGKRKATEEGHTDLEDSQRDKEQSLTSEPSTHHCSDYPLPSNDESITLAGMTVKEEKVIGDNSLSNDTPCTAVDSFDQSKDVSVGTTEEPSVRGDTTERDNDGEDRNANNEMEDLDLEIKENDENMLEETSAGGKKDTADIKPEEKMQEESEEQDIVICSGSSEIWDELQSVICEIIEEEENRQTEQKLATEGVADEGCMIQHDKAGDEEEQIAKISEEEPVEADGGGEKEAEVRVEIAKESTRTSEEKLQDTEMQREFEEKETKSTKTKELDERQHHGREEIVSVEKDNSDKERDDEPQRKPPSIDQVRSEVKELKEGQKYEESDSSLVGAGRKVVVSKNPKVYQVKAVPVVPPKPQHCRITALTLRQQQQQRERREAERGRENLTKVPTEADAICGGEQGTDGDEGGGKKEKPTLRGGEKERERRRDGDDNSMRDTSRNSPLSMCFDEAVAIATMRREKEKGCEKERQREWGNEV